MIALEDYIIPKFVPLIKPVLNAEPNELVNEGGRHSTKSTFSTLTVIYGMMRDYAKGEKTHAVCLRKVAGTLKGTIYSKIVWSINKLGVRHLWHVTKSPLKCVFKPSGQEIRFYGCDEPSKLKSTEFEEGWCKYILFEELEEFDGMDEVDNVAFSLARGGDSIIIYTYNPPPSKAHWVNIEMSKDYKERLKVHSTYLDVPDEWITKQVIQRILRIKAENEDRYKNLFLGKVIGIGGEIFKNVKPLDMKDMLDSFDKINNGLDFGSADPTAFTRNYFNNNELYIFNEVYKSEMLNKDIKQEVDKLIKQNEYIYGDNAARNQIQELNNIGLKVLKCKKVQGDKGRDYSIDWLRNLKAIYIDPIRCPNTYREFTSYMYKRTKDGTIIDKYPDMNDHTIDSTRYSLSDIIFRNKLVFA